MATSNFKEIINSRITGSDIVGGRIPLLTTTTNKFIIKSLGVDFYGKEQLANGKVQVNESTISKLVNSSGSEILDSNSVVDISLLPVPDPSKDEYFEINIPYLNTIRNVLINSSDRDGYIYKTSVEDYDRTHELPVSLSNTSSQLGWYMESESRYAYFITDGNSSTNVFTGTLSVDGLPNTTQTGLYSSPYSPAVPDYINKKIYWMNGMGLNVYDLELDQITSLGSISNPTTPSSYSRIALANNKIFLFLTTSNKLYTYDISSKTSSVITLPNSMAAGTSTKLGVAHFDGTYHIIFSSSAEMKYIRLDENFNVLEQRNDHKIITDLNLPPIDRSNFGQILSGSNGWISYVEGVTGKIIIANLKSGENFSISKGTSTANFAPRAEPLHYNFSNTDIDLDFRIRITGIEIIGE